MLHTNTLVNNLVTSALSEASSILSEEGCTHTSLLDSLIDHHSSTGASTNILEELKTPYRQKKFFKEEMGLIELKLVTFLIRPSMLVVLELVAHRSKKFRNTSLFLFLNN
jgi:hypothetical protein